MKNLSHDNELCNEPNESYNYNFGETESIDMLAVFQTELGDRLLTELYSKKTIKQIKEFLDEIQAQELSAELLTELENEAELCLATVYKKQ